MSPHEIGGTRVRRSLFAPLAAAALVCFTGLFNHALWTPDEPRVAEIGREMFSSGDWVVPRLAGDPFVEKPPLYWWCMLPGYSALGVSDGTARLPSALFSLLTSLLVFDMARRMRGRRAAWISAGVLLTLASFSYHGHRATTDSALSFFVALGYWAFYRAVFAAPRERPDAKYLLLLHAAGGLAFLSKGMVGVGLLHGPLVLYALGARRWAVFRSWAHLPGLGLLALMMAAWPLFLAERCGSEVVDTFVMGNVIGRFLPSGGQWYRGGHRHPATYYLTAGPTEFLPWLLALPALFRHILRSRRSPGVLPPGLACMTLIMPLGVGLLSLASTKRGLYLLPLMAPTAVAVGVWLSGPGTTSRDRWERVTRGLLRGSAGVLLLTLAIGAGAVVLRPSLLSDEPAGYAGVGLPAAGLLLGSIAALAVLLVDRRRGGGAVRGATLGLCAGVLLVNVFGYRILDPVKTLRPFVQSYSKLELDGPPAIGWALDETTRAILPFYGATPVHSIRNGEELLEYVRKAPATPILVLEKRAKTFPEELVDELEQTWKWDETGGRVYAVYGLRNRESPDPRVEQAASIQ